MSVIQFYAALATTAGIFVGILTAFLVTRLSDYKSQRTEIKRRVRTIDEELAVLESRYELRQGNLEETEERWRIEQAEDEVDEFIEYTVGRDWNPDPDTVSSTDAVDALVRFDRVAEGELIQHHLDQIESRWNEITDELQSSRHMLGDVDLGGSEEYTAANWIIEALWEIYDQEKYDSEDSSRLNIQKQSEELKREREVLEAQFDAHNPEQLQDGIKESIVPIVLSVVAPLLAIFLIETGLKFSIPWNPQLVEISIVSIVWLCGFFWTLWFLWRRVSNNEDELPEISVSIDEMMGDD